MNDVIVVGTCNNLVRQVLLALRSFSDRRGIVIGGPNTRGLRQSRLCAMHLEHSFAQGEEQQLVDLLTTVARTHPDAIVLPADCEGIRAIQRVHTRIPLRVIPIPDPATLEMLDDKWRFFAFCRRAGLPTPATIQVGHKRDLDFDALASQLGVPFVIKPSNQAGSEGVQVIHDREHFEQAVLHNTAYGFSELIAQQYIDGIDVCIDLFAVEGRVTALAFQQRTGAEIRFFADADLQKTAHRLAQECRYHGVMNLDVRIEHGTGRIYLIESNPRFWASLTASAGCGLNFVAESLAPSRTVRMLTAGTFHMRHPLLRPASWLPLLFDSSGYGRLLRAKMVDMHTLVTAMRAAALKPLTAIKKPG